jgi:hypothetical protein
MDDSSKSQQMHYVFYHNVKQKDYVESNIHHHQGLVIYNKKNGTITMNRHVFNEHFDVLKLNNAKRLATTTPISIDAQWSSKKWKNLTTHSINPFHCWFFFALESLTRNLIFLKKNLLRIYVFISPKGTTHFSPIKG